MSRLGKRPIFIPAGVSVKTQTENRQVEVKGPKGTLQWVYPEGIKLSQESSEGGAMLRVLLEEGRSVDELSSLWGLSRARLAWMIQGVMNGFTKQLEIQGVGYRAKVEGSKLILSIGTTVPISFPIPSTITVTVDSKQTGITIAGIDKELVGHLASQIRNLKPPEPYKGKGIRYASEEIIKKAGKTAVSTGAGVKK